MAKKIIIFLSVLILFTVFINYKSILGYFYPRHYSNLVIKYSNMYNLDTNLVYSLIKAESKFNPYARSNKYAIGLMQITPTTGKYIADLMQDKNYTDNILFDPETNIKYGCFYISKLYKDFDGDINCVLAAYNGGEGNVRKWLQKDKQGNSYLDVNKIPFSETRDYIKNVKKDYQIYKFLYDKRSAI